MLGVGVQGVQRKLLWAVYNRWWIGCSKYKVTGISGSVHV